MKREDLIDGFPMYLDIWQRLDREYRRTPGWRMIRQQRILNQMHRLTKKYSAWFEDWMIQTKKSA